MGRGLDALPGLVTGGAIEVNGRGTLIATEECLLDPEVQVRPTRGQVDDLTVDAGPREPLARELVEERVDGVSNSNVLGGREEELQVVIDPQKLASRGLTITDVRASLRAQNEDTSGGEHKRQFEIIKV